MSAVLLPFPNGGRIEADENREATLRRVRFAERALGCNRVQVEMAQAHAEGLLNGARHYRRDQVVQAARSFAAHLLTKEPA